MIDASLDWLVIGIAAGDTASARADHLAREATSRSPALCIRYRDARRLVLSRDPVTIVRRGDDERLIVVGQVSDIAAVGPTQTGDSAGDWLDALSSPGGGSLAAKLCERAWGAYVAVWDEDGGDRLMTDPSGARPAVVVRDGPLSLAATDIPRWLWRALGVTPTISWTRVAASMVRSVVPTHEPLLRGVRLAIPGQPLSLADPMLDIAPIWSPTMACGRPSPTACAADLRAVVRATVLHQALGRPTLVQLSGGLDSSIILSSLASGLTPGSLVAFTMATRHEGGDERKYAALAAAASGVRLESASAPERPVHHGRWLEIDHGVRPYLYGLDDAFEQAIADTAAAFGVELVMTGQGGDAVFFEMPTPGVTADRVRRDGWRALFSRAAVADAERCNVSMWALVRAVMADRLGLPDRPQALLAPDLLSPDARAVVARGVPVHPWIVEARGLPPGRRLQIEAIANAQIFFAPRPVSGCLAIAHPLLAQPVVDHVLSLSTADLCFGVGDRALARLAFADDLPDAIIERRVKGEASSHYAHAILADLPALRGMLLDGPLVSAGILDRAATERAMDPRTLIFGDAFRALSLYASLSAWARYWQRST